MAFEDFDIVTALLNRQEWDIEEIYTMMAGIPHDAPFGEHAYLLDNLEFDFMEARGKAKIHLKRGIALGTLKVVSYTPWEGKESHLVTSNDFLLWCKGAGTYYCQHYQRALEKGWKDPTIEEASRARPTERLTETERGKLLTIVLGMAMDGYSYDPNEPRNTATGENKGSIKAALQRSGLDADKKTISRYLEEAAKLYPDAKPPKF